MYVLIRIKKVCSLLMYVPARIKKVGLNTPSGAGSDPGLQGAKRAKMVVEIPFEFVFILATDAFLILTLSLDSPS